MKIYDLFDMRSLGEMIQGGFVRSQTHPDYPQLVILNYTETCAYQRVWNEITTACRGLIYDADTGLVLARPWPKFMNHGEPGAYESEPGESVIVTDKLDGSLGVGFRAPDGFEIATRGSFTSEQARHATELWRRDYGWNPGWITVPPGITPLFEIIYPGNRIVVSYDDLDALVLLGAVDIETGMSMPPDQAADLIGWPGPIAEIFPYRTLTEALESAPRPGKEGFVIHFPESDQRVKWKYEEYIALHRIITGCTARRLWEHAAVIACRDLGETGFLVRRLFLGPDRVSQILAAGDGWLESFQKNTPEEFWQWVQDRVCEMESVVAKRGQKLRADFGVLCAMAGVEPSALPAREDSKTFAAVAREKLSEDFHYMMAQWRGNEIDTALWREVYPAHELPYRVVDEEA